MTDQAKEIVKRKIALAKQITGARSSRQLGLQANINPSTITRAESDDPQSTMSTPNVTKLDNYVKAFVESGNATDEAVSLYKSQYLNVATDTIFVSTRSPTDHTSASKRSNAKELLASLVSKQADRPSAQIEHRADRPSAQIEHRADIPVYGTAAGSIVGSMQVEEGRQVSFVERPRGLRSSARAYALIVTGSSMAPQFKEGDLVFVDPDRKITAGDTIIIQTQNFNKNYDEPTRAYIKTFRGVMDNVLYTEQLNPPAKLDFPMKGKKDGAELVYSYDRVLTTRELFDV